MIFATSDLHGWPLDAFRRLLDSAGFTEEDELYVLGDVIDRGGEGGVETLHWILRQPNAKLLMGNHEAMMLACSFLYDTPEPKLGELLAGDEERFERMSTWIANGGEPTLASLWRLGEEDRGALDEMIDEVRCAPLWTVVYAGGRRIVLTHAGLGGFATNRPLSDYAPDELLWHRPALTERYWSRQLTIFGHTPTLFYGPEYAGRMIVTDTWIDIDTGASAGGSPMLLRLDDLQPFYADGLL